MCTECWKAWSCALRDKGATWAWGKLTWKPSRTLLHGCPTQEAFWEGLCGRRTSRTALESPRARPAVGCSCRSAQVAEFMHTLSEKEQQEGCEGVWSVRNTNSASQRAHPVPASSKKRGCQASCAASQESIALVASVDGAVAERSKSTRGESHPPHMGTAHLLHILDPKLLPMFPGCYKWRCESA